jgi:uncharacterized damage-inducible protein DinB
MSSATQPALSAQFVSQLRDLMLERIEKERATTQRVIGNIPNDKRDYRPHANSRSAWDLACHLATSDIWFLNGVANQSFEWTGETPPPANTVAELCQWYEQEHKKAAAKLRTLTPEQLAKTVPFFGIFDMPAALYLQFAQDHAVHHRGQLTTYLRPMGAKVPDIYGGSFDEPFTGQ